MRIVVTKNGTKFIEDLSLNNSLDYNSDTNQNIECLNIIKSKLKNLKKNKSVNQITKPKKNKKLYTQSLSNLNNNIEKIDINNILNNNTTNGNSNNDINANSNNNIKNLKFIKLKSSKKFKLPKLIEDKYIFYDAFNEENKNLKKNFISKILLSINDSMDNDILHKKTIKRNKTIYNIYTNNTQKEESKKINLNSNNNNVNSNDEEQLLPKIRKSFPLKYIINKDSYKRLNKEMKNLENCCNLEKKLFPKNYFIKNNWENSKRNFDLSLKNEINSKNVNLIEYLNKNKKISNIFVQKFSMLDKDQINKLDSITKKLLEKKAQDKQIKKNIKNKIKANIMNINIDFRQKLNIMNDRLSEYGLIINKEKDKFLLNDKNKYIEQFMDAEKNWEKYRLERLYKKSASPRRSIYRPL